MLEDIAVLAADPVAYNAALQDFQASVSLAGVGLLVGGVSLLLSKHKVFGVVVCVAALAIIAYPWLAFEPMPVR